MNPPKEQRTSHRRRLPVVTVFAAWLGCLCAGTPLALAQTAGVHVVTSFYPMYIATLNIAGEVPGVALRNLAAPQTGCLHDYQLTTADMRLFAKTDILVINGAGMESFLDRVIKTNPKVAVIDASAGIDLITDGEAATAHGGLSRGGNPHIWLSPSLHIRQIRNIAQGLARADPAHAAAYRRNAEAYAGRVAALRDRMQAALQGLGRRDIITFHEAFPYLAREFGLKVAAVIEREPGTEPDARELADTIQLVRRTGVTALFVEPQYPAKAAETIAKETGTRLLTLDPAVTGPQTANAYLEIMERNSKALVEGLK
jgi:zinc transport system substrate-binding protein